MFSDLEERKVSSTCSFQIFSHKLTPIILAFSEYKNGELWNTNPITKLNDVIVLQLKWLRYFISHFLNQDNKLWNQWMVVKSYQRKVNLKKENTALSRKWAWRTSSLISKLCLYYYICSKNVLFIVLFCITWNKNKPGKNRNV